MQPAAAPPPAAPPDPTPSGRVSRARNAPARSASNAPAGSHSSAAAPRSDRPTESRDDGAAGSRGEGSAGSRGGAWRPSAAEVAAAAGRTIPDLVGPGLRVLFSGINPSLYSAATGHHFARPGNRFWPALHRSGFTARLLHPSEQELLPAAGLGITNVVARATARADELSPAELIEGGEALTELVARWQPRYLAVLGVTAYRAAFGFPKARIGPQDQRIADVPVWVLPNPSGLNASWNLDQLATAFGALRDSATSESSYAPSYFQP